MLNAVLEAVTVHLTERGLNAVRQFPEERAAVSEPLICVGAQSCKAHSPGLGDYLGVRRGVGGAADSELYGMRLEMVLSFDLFSPFEATRSEADCVRCADELKNALGSLPSGIRALEYTVGSVSADNRLELFTLRCTLKCAAYFVAENQEGQETEFLDYVLKGTVTSDN